MSGHPILPRAISPVSRPLARVRLLVQRPHVQAEDDQGRRRNPQTIVVIGGRHVPVQRLPGGELVGHIALVRPGLRYADAVRLLGGSSPLLKLADDLLGGALTVATAGGSEVALSLFDAKAEVIRLGHLVGSGLAERVRGLGRYDRTRRLHAAHAVLVVKAFFEALDSCLREAGMRTPRLARKDQITLALKSRSGGTWTAALFAEEVPAPGPDRGVARLADDLREHYARLTREIVEHLSRLAIWDEASASTQVRVQQVLVARLPNLALRRYEESVVKLAAEVPEFGIWMQREESRAAARGLEDLEAALLRVSSRRAPSRLRGALAAAYRSSLDRPVHGGDTGGLTMPSLGTAYLDPRFRVRTGGRAARPAEEPWWEPAEPRANLAGFLASYLTTPQAADAPLLLLGQPGAGKSSLTKVLAGRLPAADFLVVRVALRDVRAEAEIQDQVEQALRAALGEYVAWADLAGDSDGAMPVVLLDGFDELLQATGVHQSDYLQRVAAFQQREAVLGRPVAVLVTSRIAVADRARLPDGSLVVRLEPFDDPQIKQWLQTWNQANEAVLADAGLRPLPLEVLSRFPDLAAQPLLLLMLALYDATANALQNDAGSFDAGQLYERLLREFAGREVRRLTDGQPDTAVPDMIEAELLRLSVVAFAMFHRLRLWATTEELDADLAGFDLQPLQTGTEDLRTPITAGQEMVGRFFFIQRAQAVRDDRTLQTYEFLHATFGEYLVARLTVQAIRDAAARARARTLRLGPSDEDDLLQSLLGFTPLTARATVPTFVTELLRREAVDGSRQWLVDRLRVAVTRPQYVQQRYRPVDKRADHWMATYSFNLMLLTLACGKPLRATELFQEAADPAGWLRDMALQWRAAVPDGMWRDAMSTMTVSRGWSEDGRRDLILLASPDSADEAVEPFWSHQYGPNWEFRHSDVGSGFSNFNVDQEIKSMHLSGALSDDVLRHAVEPLLGRLPLAVLGFVLHGRDDAESVAHSLFRLWLASSLDDEPERLRYTYGRAAVAVSGAAWGPAGEAPNDARDAIRIFLRWLAADAHRLPTADLIRLTGMIRTSAYFDDGAHSLPMVECLLAAATASDDDATADELLYDAARYIARLLPEDCLRLLNGLARNRPPRLHELLGPIDERLDSPIVADWLDGDPGLAGRLAQARARCVCRPTTSG
jgi:hypothetical protein